MVNKLESCAIQELCRNGDRKIREKSDTANKRQIPEQEVDQSSDKTPARKEAGVLMETLEHTQETRTNKEIFDPCAAVRMAREDIEAYGDVQAGTWQQIYNEELTYIAESLDAPHKTVINYSYQPGIGLRDERNVAFAKMLQNGREAAEERFHQDPRAEFHLVRTHHHQQEGFALEAMMEGRAGFNTLISFSPFPEEAYLEHGAEFVKDIGYNPDRKIGFIYVFTKQSETQMQCTAATVDNSDLEVFRNVAATLGKEVSNTQNSDDFLGERITLELDAVAQARLVDQIVDSYDAHMGLCYEGQGVFRNGRNKNFQEVDGWDFATAQHDLIEYYLREIETLAKSNWDEQSILQAKKILTVSVWTEMSDRLHNVQRKDVQLSDIAEYSSNAHLSIDNQINLAFHRALGRRAGMVGCGGSISLDVTAITTKDDLETLTDIGFGPDKTKLIWKKGKCRVPDCKNKEELTEVAQCNVCRSCQAEFDKGIRK